MSWAVAWSAKVTAPAASIVAGRGWVVVGHGRRMTCFSDDGEHLWTRDLLFTPHQLVHDGHRLGVLAAHGFTVHTLEDGEPLHEGRSVPRGFSSLAARPGGGWLASGREGGLHLFSNEGRGRQRIEIEAPRAVRGWIDRDHAVVHAQGGHLQVVGLGGSEDVRPLGEERWTWSSPLARDGMLLRAADGTLHLGVPGGSGWDRLDRIDGDLLEPVAGLRTEHGWCVLELDGRVRALLEEGAFQGSEGGLDPIALVTSDGAETVHGVTREGLIRCWYGGERERVEREARRALVIEDAKQQDWALRRRRFEAAVEAEEQGDWEAAAQHYEALGRMDDVKRVRRAGGGD